MADRVFQIGDINLECICLSNLINLLNKGSKFIPSLLNDSFSIFKFILYNFDYNFNAFNSKINLNQKKFEKYGTEINQNVAINFKPIDSLNDLFGLKCKKIRNSFNKLKFPTSKDSLDFKFNFYKSLSDLNFTNTINIKQSELYFFENSNMKNLLK